MKLPECPKLKEFALETAAQAFTTSIVVVTLVGFGAFAIGAFVLIQLADLKR